MSSPLPISTASALYFLRLIQRLPSQVQGYYTNYLKNEYIQHRFDSEKPRVAQLVHKGMQDALWILNKYKAPTNNLPKFDFNMKTFLQDVPDTRFYDPTLENSSTQSSNSSNSSKSQEKIKYTHDPGFDLVDS